MPLYSLAQSRPFDLLVFPCWSIFSTGPKRLTFYFQVFWESECINLSCRSPLFVACSRQTRNIAFGQDLLVLQREFNGQSDRSEQLGLGFAEVKSTQLALGAT